MKKLSALVLLLGGAILAMLLLASPTPPTRAAQPRPTPTAEFPGQPCRFETNRACDIRQITAFIERTAGPHYNPPLDAREVPTHTLISTTFEADMDPATITGETFYVTQGQGRLPGSVDYIASGRMAVFYPETPLTPDRTYTATMTAEVQSRAGEPLAEARVWRFTTAAENSRFGQVANPAALTAAQSRLNVYFGDLHSHSGYSAGSVGTPAEVFASARAGGLDFFALTEHDRHLDAAEWQDVLIQAEAATSEGVFIGIRGFEYTNYAGHINVFDTQSYVSAGDPNYDEFAELYAWLAGHPTAIGQFNHPGPGLNFNDFAYVSPADHKIVLHEIISLEQVLLALDAGWHLGTLLNSDGKSPPWGRTRRMGLLAPRLTEADILAAMRAGRTFYVPPNNPDFALVLQADGVWMGSAAPYTGMANFTVTAYDSTPSSADLTINLYENGRRVAATTLPGGAAVAWRPALPTQVGAYYFVEAYQAGWLIPAYSSPIWVERRPFAEAGPDRVVAPGQTVRLDGSGSRDLDGDALVYHWTQDSGPPVALSDSGAVRPTFTAPAGEGELAFRLTVVDPGRLSAADTTIVLATSRPVLTVAKRGPAVANPGQPIDYTLTITNRGLTEAAGVVVTDVVPAGAAYVSGGTLLANNVVSWTIPTLAANGGTAEVGFVVTAETSIVNDTYGAACPDCIPAVGRVSVVTGGGVYLPLIKK